MMRGLIFYFPFLAPLLISLAFSIYVSFLDHTECTFLLGINVSLLGLLTFCFLLPITCAIGSLYPLYFSIKAKELDFYPPPNTPWIGVFKQRKGKQAQIIKVLGYLIPILGIWLVWLGSTSFVEIADGRTLPEISVSIGEACEKL